MTVYFHFEVTLVGIEPRIWRSFLLVKSASFFDLHEAIQRACGWGDSHLFQFARPGRGPAIAGVPDKSGMGPRVPDAKKVALATVIGSEPDLYYDYDFGDGWRHEIVLKGITERDGSKERILLGGERAFPPEDSGGPWGYARCVAAATGEGWTNDMGDTSERAQLKEWFGKWEPDAFDLVKTKRAFDR